MPKHIKIFDTTLRDGEQSPGCSMNIEEKIEMAKMLERLNVDIIEAGFAISSPGDFASVEAIAKVVQKPTVASLCRAVEKDIDASWDALRCAKHPRLHIVIATSPIHLKYKLGKSPNEVLAQAVRAVKYAKAKAKNVEVEFSAEDASRSDWDFLVKIFSAVIDAGAKVVNVPDTNGYAMPLEFGRLIAYLKKNIRNLGQAEISVHNHNDLGLAVATSLAAIENGATQCEATINGIGERAGNCSLEELVMALKVRQDYYGKDKRTQINTKFIYPASRLLSSITGVQVQPNKAIVGANAFAHESGIHQDGVLKHRETYEIIRPADIGRADSKLVLGKHSGRHALSVKLKELGYTDLDPNGINNVYAKFKVLADKKKEITEWDLEALVSDGLKQVQAASYSLETLRIETGNKTQPTAELSVKYQDKTLRSTQSGNGPVDAIFKAIDDIIQRGALGIHLLDYVVQAVTEGTDALGRVTVRIKKNQKTYTGNGANTDVLVASAEAYLNAVNKYLLRSE
ncbi:2-isopropylmalate synthase [Candidatus Termititenax persephonae]|uniref:2-isopropylmalate synthase n=1 Tax=Candidatus Termititenax persephonae TaxID=2218525 RepID=A0A388TID8_9BACT|nr:2-isopropylmalate synthase [Candidatus Termititenax persephonae]